MSDAQERFEAWLQDTYPYGVGHGRVTATAKDAYLAGFATGAESMRERAADIANNDYQASHSTPTRIRALPIEPPTHGESDE